ncbi:unnamed protein product [Fraxinus pennsylvanica]|uniref:Glutaredoxin domain-containing protein n=1 Tax=Fraxinus pennsylvanica TaxID=56036 RepID=A0AAD2A140_9LAMI|nr:unnamed protein product [Fraxinus pennsylvanica]
MKSLEVGEKIGETESEKRSYDLKEGDNDEADSRGTNKNLEEILYGVEEEPGFYGTEIPEMEANLSLSMSLYFYAPSFIHDEDKNHSKDNDSNGSEDSSPESEAQEVSKNLQRALDGTLLAVLGFHVMLGVKTRCQDCKETRRFLHGNRLQYVEIIIDVYPSRKLELEKIAGSYAVPRVSFNELIGGLAELKSLEESGKLEQKIEIGFTNCAGSPTVFWVQKLLILSDDQYLEREEENEEMEQSVTQLLQEGRKRKKNKLSPSEMKSLEVGQKIGETESEKRSFDLKEGENDEADSKGTNKNLEEILYGVEEEPGFYGTEIPEMEAN